MNFDVRNHTETETSIHSIEGHISRVKNEIEKEFSFKGNTLERLMAFKLEKQKASTKEDTVDFKNSLIAEIKSKADLGEIASQTSETLTQAKYEVLATKIIQINKLTGEIQGEIQKLRAEYLKSSLENFQLKTDDFITKKWYTNSTLSRINNPQNMSDELLGFSMSAIESIVTTGKFAFDVVKGTLLSPYHLVQILRGKAKYDGVEI